MSTAEQLTTKEIARRGDELMETVVTPRLVPSDREKFVAIDVASGEFELDADDFTAIQRLRDRIPAAEIWLAQVGYSAACRFGASG